MTTVLRVDQQLPTGADVGAPVRKRVRRLGLITQPGRGWGCSPPRHLVNGARSTTNRVACTPTIQVLFGGGAGAVEGAGGGADVHVEGDADAGVAGEA